MKKLFLPLALFFILGLQVPSQSQYTPHRPPTFCEDQCLIQYSRSADGHLHTYRFALQSIVDQALLAVVSAWVGYLSERTAPKWGSASSTTLALYQANAFNEAIFQAELSYYNDLQSDLNTLNSCLATCPPPNS